jgi:hypothetical protein
MEEILFECVAAWRWFDARKFRSEFLVVVDVEKPL